MKKHQVKQESEASGMKKQPQLPRHEKHSPKRRYLVSLLLVVCDVIFVAAGYFLALWLQYHGRVTQIPSEYLKAWLYFLPVYAVVCVAVFWAFHLYHSLWKFASLVEFKRIALSSIILSAFHSLFITILFGWMPLSYYIVGLLIQFLLVLASRFAYRFMRSIRDLKKKEHYPAAASRVMLIGAGAAGNMVLRDMHNAKEINEVVCCIIDDDKNKWGLSMEGVPIVGGRDDILVNVEKYRIEKIYLTMPSSSAADRRDILTICNWTHCELKTLPGMYELVNEGVTVSSLKDVAVEDLLGRDPVEVNMNEIYDFIAGKVILVTGGGGSIGSELCRQIAQHAPKQLIIFDIYENNAFAIGGELREKHPDLNLEVLIGSVRDSRRINGVFAKYKPEVVYHAAAHKHVPLMEDSPCESIKNNAVGTYKTAYAAMMNGCKRFVLISTDKAVNPTNIMGASKRLCEMIIQTFDRKIRNGKAHELTPIRIHSQEEDGAQTPAMPFTAEEAPKTEFVAVRFGNVLGSNGSVIPTFKKQIEKGGPVTVTHPDIIRYFMTIPEAASLVLQAGVYAEGGEIFVLDMGEPVKIDTLARNLIRLSGLEPDVDIPIAYTGLRPGEKLYEEKLMAEEGLKMSPNKKISIGRPLNFDPDVFLEDLRGLLDAAYNEQQDTIRELVAKTVTTYQYAKKPASVPNADAEDQSRVKEEQPAGV